MKVNKFLSNYVKSKDLKSPVTLTISSAEEEVFQAGKPDEKAALVLYFKEIEQGIVLCKESIRQLADMFESEDTDGWVGKRVEAFNDPSVKFGGKPVGGIRFRAPGKGKA